MTAHALGRVAAVRVVMGREVRELSRTRAVRWGTLVLVLLSAGLALLPRFLPDTTDPAWTVAVAGSAPAGLAPAVAALAEVEQVTITWQSTDLDPDVAVRDDDVDAVLVDATTLVVEDEPPDRLAGLLNAAVARATLAADLGALGVTPEQAAGLAGPAALQVRSVDGGEDREARQTVAFLGTVALMLAIVTYGGWVLNSVLEEKANRIVELVVSAVRPSELLAAKVIGVGLVGLGQLLTVVAAGVVVGSAAGTLPDLPDFAATAVAAALGWFVLGFAFYAVGYAAAGSLTSRQEDAASAASPLVALVLGAYFLSLLVVNPDPDGTAARVLSLIPPITPLAMPIRMANDAVAAWEVALAVVLLLAATVLMTRLAASIYAGALLHSGGRIKARAALRARDR